MTEAAIKSTPVRVRFAPSPTGFLHVGNVRTALFNWLFARHHGGTFILRVEDTDAERSKSKYELQLREDLLWLGLDWDEGVGLEGPSGPYRQSDRYPIYQQFAQRLLEQDKAFLCFCSEEDLEQVRREQLARNELPIYSGKCRNLTALEAEALLKTGIRSTLRLRVRPGTVGFTDMVFGRIEINTDQISDPVLLRSDGSPTYNFCCVVDDLLMKVTHIIRGDGHLPNTHRQILIYEALDAQPPQFAHLSTILGPDAQKLSKRHGATSVEEFRQKGYLPQALINYLSLLGWSPTREGMELMPAEEIVRQFDLSRVLRSPAIFDPAKLDWMNRSYINKTPGEDLVKIAKEYFISSGIMPPQLEPPVAAWLGRAIDAVKTRVDRLEQLPLEMSGLFAFETNPPELDGAALETLQHSEALTVAREFARRLNEVETVTPEIYREIVAQVKAATGQRGRNLFHPIRAALTGRGSGPELELLIPLYEEGSRLNLLRRVMSCRERLQAVLGAFPG
jgi:nondiscriminating glutamyl-tRNA synthetase